MAGWSSNSKYPLLGGLRSSAQMVSYEVGMGLAIVGGLIFTGTLSLVGIINGQIESGAWNILYQPLGFFIFLVCGLAETNRTPFDLPEGESEIVGGFHTEYSSFRWSLFFLSEYTAVLIVRAWLRRFTLRWQCRSLRAELIGRQCPRSMRLLD